MPQRLAAQYDGLEIHGVVGDFERHLDRIPPASGRRLVAFLGGTIGNLDEPERRRLLQALRRQLGPDDRLLVGTDLVKDRARLEAAYNDAAGVTAEFNRNLLHVINANLGADLDPDGFEHVAFYNEAERRIEMWLRAREEMRARIDALEMDVGFERGEEIRTEISCKFTRETLEREYRAVGLEPLAWYTDPDGLFALSLTGPADLTLQRLYPDRGPVAACGGVRLARPAGAGPRRPPVRGREHGRLGRRPRDPRRAHRGASRAIPTASCSTRCAPRWTP